MEITAIPKTDLFRMQSQRKVSPRILFERHFKWIRTHSLTGKMVNFQHQINRQVKFLFEPKSEVERHFGRRSSNLVPSFVYPASLQSRAKTASEPCKQKLRHGPPNSTSTAIAKLGADRAAASTTRMKSN